MSDQTRASDVTEEQLARIEAGVEHPPKPDFVSDQEWEMLTAGRQPTMIRNLGTMHAEGYKAAGGEGVDETQGAPVLLLTTTGRKSGKDVTTPLNYFQDGDDLFVVGSFAGLRAEPHWVLNLEKEPRGWVQVKDRRWEVDARRLEGEARAREWPRLVEFFPLWGHFQKYCRREFAVFVLTPRNAS